MHAQAEEHLGNGHLHQRREVHEDAEYYPGQIPGYRVLSSQGFYPFRAD
jgi:hypothetical protein